MAQGKNTGSVIQGLTFRTNYEVITNGHTSHVKLEQSKLVPLQKKQFKSSYGGTSMSVTVWKATEALKIETNNVAH